MRYPHAFLSLLLAAATACSSGSPPNLPVATPTGDLVRTRAELEQRLADNERQLASSGGGVEEESRLAAEAEAIRERLQYGDFRVGDDILLRVEGEQLPDTVRVEPGQVIDLPVFGQIPVGGVLRSEIEEHLAQELSRFLREPQVRASGLVRVAVLGSVGDPGFYTMPAETVIGDAIMVAGGPSGNANVDQVRIRRGTEEIMGGGETRVALQRGLTLDQLNFQNGDQITVPERRGVLRLLGVVTGIVGSLSFLVWRFT